MKAVDLPISDDLGKIEEHGADTAKVLFHFLSRNTVNGMHKATQEELLQEIINELKMSYEKDAMNLSQTDREEEDYAILYPTFIEAVNAKAELYKQVSYGYRQLCSIPTFALGLVMASRIRRHYVHARWFRLGTLSDMVNVYGTVSERVSMIRYEVLTHTAVYIGIHHTKRRSA